jgi:hypothetical protein
MKGTARRSGVTGLALLVVCSANLSCSPAARDPLPSWTPGAVKHAIIAFVKEVTTRGGARYLPPEERVATFDNDGTLWIEKPHYVELMYLLDHIKRHAPEHPPWENRQSGIINSERREALL